MRGGTLFFSDFKENGDNSKALYDSIHGESFSLKKLKEQVSNFAPLG